MDQAFKSAEYWWWGVLGIDVLMIGTSYLATTTPSHYAAMTTGLVMAVLFVHWLASGRLDNAYARGEEIRRHHLVANGLGRHPRRDVALRLQLIASDDTPSRSYFASQQGLGTLDSARNIAESAFFTSRNARLASSTMLGLWGFLAAATVYVVWIAAASVSTELALWVLILSMVAFLTSGRLLSSTLGFRALATASQDVYTGAVRLCHETQAPELALRM